MSKKGRVPLPPVTKLLTHLMRNMVIGIIFIAIALLIGMTGYHYFEDQSWIDAFLSASMILSGMGPSMPIATFSGKLFAGFYALFSGLVFIAIIVLIFSPLIHRFFHKLHIDMDSDDER